MIEEAGLSQTELALTADVIGAVGTGDFYERVLALLGERIQCERRLVMKYSRYARPEFVFNASLHADAVAVYLDGLYRLDPLLRLVRTESLRPVVTYREIRQIDLENAFFDEIFRAGMVLDELAVLLPTLGGATIGLCFDRDEGYFGYHESEWARMLYPLLLRTHDLHVRTAMLRGLDSLSGEGRVGILALSDAGQAVYRNESWRRMVRGADEAAIAASTLARPAGDPVEIGDCIGHWETLEPAGGPMGAYRALFLEERSAGHVDRNMRAVLTGFIAAHGLSSRESQILEKMMRGHPTASISAKLGLTAGTVKNYKRRLYDKLDITNEREIFPLFINHLFAQIDPPPAEAVLPGATAAQGR